MHPQVLASCPLPLRLDRGYEQLEAALEGTVLAHGLETIVWECTSRCNITCLHCGTMGEPTGSLRELTTSQAKRMFDRLDEAFGLSDLTCVSITGGEPTVRDDLVEMVEHIRAYGVPQIVTHSNGHRLAREPGLAEALGRAGVTGIGINLDGLRENHTWLRQNPDAFECSVLALQQAQDAGVDTMISTVLTKRVIGDLGELRELLVDLRPDRWRLLPIEPIGRASAALTDELLSPEDLAEVLGFVVECQTLELPFGVEMGCGQWYGKQLEGFVRPYIWHCIAGINVLGIMSDGSIGACNNIDRSYCQGNVLEDDVKDVWQYRFDVFRDREWARNDECIDCSDWGLCKGGEMHMRSPLGERLSPCFFQWLTRRQQADGREEVRTQ